MKNINVSFNKLLKVNTFVFEPRIELCQPFQSLLLFCEVLRVLTFEVIK